LQQTLIANLFDTDDTPLNQADRSDWPYDSDELHRQ